MSSAHDGSFKSPDLGSDKTFSFTFEKAGTYTYSCHIHPDMTGTVVRQRRWVAAAAGKRTWESGFRSVSRWFSTC